MTRGKWRQSERGVWVYKRAESIKELDSHTTPQPVQYASTTARSPTFCLYVHPEGCGRIDRGPEITSDVERRVLIYVEHASNGLADDGEEQSGVVHS